MSITIRFMLTAALALLPVLAVAQTPPRGGQPAVPAAAAPSRNTVTFVLVESLGVDTAAAIIVRRPVHQPQNVILVTSATTAADLVAAVAILNRSRRARGDSLANEMRALIPRANDEVARRSRNYEQAVTHLERLRIADAQLVEGVGTFPAVTSTLAPARSR